MSRVLIFGSRTFAPLSVVRRDVHDLSDGSVVFAIGVSSVANAARESALERDIVCHDLPLTSDRAELITEATAGDVDAVIAYAARDPETRQITEGTAALIGLLCQHGVEVEIRSSPLTAVQAMAYHHLELELGKMQAVSASRRGYRAKRVTEAALALYECHAALYAWLDANDTDPLTLKEIRRQYLEDDVQPVPADAAETTWLRNLNRYQLISQILNEARAALPGMEAKAA